MLEDVESWSEGLTNFHPQSVYAVVLDDHSTGIKLTKSGQDIPLAHTDVPELPGHLGCPLLLLPNLAYHQNKTRIRVESALQYKYLLAFFPPNMYISSSLIWQAWESSRICISSRMFLGEARTIDHLSVRESYISITLLM